MVKKLLLLFTYESSFRAWLFHNYGGYKDERDGVFLLSIFH